MQAMARQKRKPNAKHQRETQSHDSTDGGSVKSVAMVNSQSAREPSKPSDRQPQQAIAPPNSDLSTSSDMQLSSLVIPLDRLQAFVRFVWRGVVGAGCIWLGRSIWPGPDYQTIVYLSFLIFAFSIALAGLIFVLAAVRWLALALWPGATRINMTNERIDLNTGAFGHDSFAWSDIDVELEGSLEADIYESLPAESIVPTLRHRPTDHNVFGSLQTYSGRPAEDLAAQIKPFVLQRLRVQEAAQA